VPAGPSGSIFARVCASEPSTYANVLQPSMKTPALQAMHLE
jgi:hypothetical protein